MVVQTAQEAVDNANATTTCDPGMCLWQTQEWLESPHQYPDATAQWKAAKYQHAGDTNPPEGAPVFWTGGGNGYGHATVSVGGGKVRSTDQQKSGKVSTVPISEIAKDWGLAYAGWTEDIAGIRLPYLGGNPTNPNQVKAGDLVLVTANGTLNGRDAPAGQVITSRPFGSQFTVAQVVDGWAQEALPEAASASLVGPDGALLTVDLTAFLTASQGWAQEQVTASSSHNAVTTPPVGLVDVKATDYLYGADVSSHQGSGWQPAADEAYVFVKATEGRSYTNPDHDAQVATVRAAGRQVGHYHWLVKGNTDAQVDYFLTQAKVQPGDLIALDWEDGSNPPTSEKDYWIRAVLDRTNGDNRVGLYCNRDWWWNHDTSSYFGDFLWIAVYGSSDPGIQAEWTFWQYTDAPYDRNRARFADLAALRAWAAPPDPVPPEPAGGAWYSTDYLFPKITPDPRNPNGIKAGDTVQVTANGGLKARILPGGPQSTDKNGKPLVRAEGYQFTVTDDLSDGWATGGTNWYSSDYLQVLTKDDPGWSTQPVVILDDPNAPSSRNVSYLQAVVRVGPVDTDDGEHFDECYVLAQDLENKGNLRFGLCDSSGRFTGEWMMVNGAGHGQTFHAYRSAAGNLYVWCGEDPAYRYAWQNGKTVSKSSGTKMDYKGSRPVGSHEPWVGFRDATSSQETFYLFDRTDFTGNVNRTKPAKSVTIAKQTKRSQQTWSVSEDRIYRLSGSTNDNPPKGTMLHVLEVFDWSGKCLLTLDVTAMSIDTTSDEPEGITFSGTPGSVLAGKREGSTDPKKRSYPIWSLTGLP